MNAITTTCYRGERDGEDMRARLAPLSRADLIAMVEQQHQRLHLLAERIDMLEHLLAPPGPRAWARLRRSSRLVRFLRRLCRA